KVASSPLLGSDQPPFDAGEVQRAGQAQAVNNFVDSALSSNPAAKIVVAGDLNEFQFEQPLNVLKGTASISNYDVPGTDPFDATATYTPGGTAVLTDLQDLLPPDQRYDYVFEGNSETLDHMLVSNNHSASTAFDIVHVNAEFFDQTSDHEPLTASLKVGGFTVHTGETVTSPQTLDGGDTGTVQVGGTLAVAAAGNGNVVAVTWTGGTSVLSNAGVISATAGRGNSRAVDTGALAAASSLTVLNAAAATIVSSTNDAIRINSDIPNGSILIDNAGFIVSGAVDAGGTITGARSGQALDLNALVSS